MKKTGLIAMIFMVFAFAVSGWSRADSTPAVPAPYDVNANAGAEINAALTEAAASRKNVLVIFGANWCKDCIELDRSLKGPSAALMKQKFVVVKVNVGEYDKNLDLSSEFGNPTKIGIPAAVLLSPDRKVIYATHGGELADARHMSDQGIYDFFNKIADRHP